MITTLMIIVFVLGYLAISLEHPIKIDKAASALLIGGVCWTLYVFSGVDAHHMNEHLSHHLVAIAEILFFLLGAMTIVELIDAHEGFKRLVQVDIVEDVFLNCARQSLHRAIVKVKACLRSKKHAAWRVCRSIW